MSPDMPRCWDLPGIGALLCSMRPAAGRAYTEQCRLLVRRPWLLVELVRLVRLVRHKWSVSCGPDLRQCGPHYVCRHRVIMTDSL